MRTLLPMTQNGNILTKNDVGTYTYAAGRAHAVAGVEVASGFARVVGRQKLTYNERNKVATVSEYGMERSILNLEDRYGSGAYDASLAISYGIDDERAKSVYSVTDTATGVTVRKETRYYDGDYEEVVRQHYDANTSALVSTTTNRITYVSSPDGLVMVKIDADRYCVVTDYLGSVERLVDKSGNVVFAASYDAWGRQTVTTRSAGLEVFRRGYTGHEHLGEFGLINMNGRIYDPVLGRFLSPDPVLQAPEMSQNYNGYSYCLNNPLKFTDPSGKFWHLIIGAAIGGVSNLISGLMSKKINSVGKGFAYFGIGALAGAGAAATCGGLSSAMAGTGFAAGAVGTEAALSANSSFAVGAVLGGAGGAISGSVTGLGNTLVDGRGLGAAFGQMHLQGLIGGATGALVGGVCGGVSAYSDNRNVWTGDDIARGRNAFSIHNTPLEGTHYITQNGPELVDNIERTGDQWVHLYDDNAHYCNDNDPLTGNYARRDNSIVPGQSVKRYIGGSQGSVEMRLNGCIQEGTVVRISYDGQVVYTFDNLSEIVPNDATVIWIPSNVKYVSISYDGHPINTYGMHGMPFKTKLIGYYGK